ncbi:MAG: hypothetical protein B7Y90_11075 [Alphaproteobacteria bacterium 32-64-14]|nr:MAG: hypothetical protein B7Y90_11075 [Alphaproteobacteria bacterium 32-64-14]
MKTVILCGLVIGLAGCAQAPLSGVPLAYVEAGGCPPAGWDRAKLDALKAGDFAVADDAARQVFAVAVAACLASPDPGLRDGVAFEALSHMLRGRQVSDATMHALLKDLTARLKQEAPDPAGFGQPFAALALAEVARADRIQPYLSEDERVTLLVDAQHWFITISDYRGFSDKDGWRHAVAHGADLLMQLALNPRVDAEGLKLIVAAVGVQVAPTTHAYIHGEPERLARPILFAAQRGVMNEAEWTGWLTALATPLDASKVISSEAGLAWRNNTLGFLQALLVNVTLSDDQAVQVLRPGVEAALKALP